MCGSETCYTQALVSTSVPQQRQMLDQKVTINMSDMLGALVPNSSVPGFHRSFQLRLYPAGIVAGAARGHKGNPSG